MTVMFIALALAVLVFVLILLVFIGTHREAPWTALDDTPPTPLAAFARSVLGVYVRKTHDDARPVEIATLAKGRR
jgi:hypothetical protein